MSLLLKSVRFFLSVFILNETKMSVFNNRRDNMRKRHIINRLDPLTAKKRRTRDVNIRRKRREKETIDNHSETRCENAICCQAAWQGQATLASRAGIAEAPVNEERSPEFLENVQEDLIKLRRGQAVEPQGGLDTGSPHPPAAESSLSNQAASASSVWHCLYVQAEKRKTQMIQRSFSTTETRTERRRKQTDCYQKGKGWGEIN